MLWTKDWDERIDHWRRALGRRLYEPFAGLTVEHFTTREALSRAQALDRPFEPIATGQRWGGLWEYGWFRSKVIIPEALVGERVIALFDTGAEMLTWLNGVEHVERWERLPQHWLAPNMFTLTERAEAGARFLLLGEGLGGKGAREVGGGPVLPGVASVPDLGSAQALVGDCSFGRFDEDLFQALSDIAVLDDLRHELPEDALRRRSIQEVLARVTVAIDPEEADRSIFAAGVATARQLMSEVLSARNGSTVPTFFTCGHGHLDIAWTWPLAEAERKIARTTAQQLTLMEQHGDHRFLSPQAWLHDRLQRRYPALFERQRQAVERGAIIVEGGCWIEPDTNMPSGEALIRNILWGKRYFKETYGIDSRIFWLPDVFGYSAALPQIMCGCELSYFVTSKLFWIYHGGDRIPYDLFSWEGIDGSTVKTHLITDYSAEPTATALIERSRHNLEQGPQPVRLNPFGYGDGGGGCRRQHIELARRAADLEGLPKMRWTHPQAFFDQVEAAGWPAERYVGELYVQVHRGVLTSHAALKHGNRRGEVALAQAEYWAATAMALTGTAADAAAFRTAWERQLTNAFHDILPGSGVARVCAEAVADYQATIAEAEAMRDAACDSLLQADDRSLTVFNRFAWPRTAMVPLPSDWPAAEQDGQALRVQDGLAQVTIPACGWTVLRRSSTALRTGTASVRRLGDDHVLENRHLRARFNAVGELVSVLDHATGHELLAGPSNRPCLFKDVPAQYDAWDIDSTYESCPVPIPAAAQVGIIASGPLRAGIRIERQIGSSTWRQEVHLDEDSRLLVFATEIDWQETHRLLKVSFDGDYHAPMARHEIQFGHVDRPTHRSRRYDRDRYEVAQHRWTAVCEEGRGFVVFNDCKYGVDVQGGCIRLSLLRASMRPAQDADKGLQRCRFALGFWNGAFAESDVVRTGYEFNEAPVWRSGQPTPPAQVLFRLEGDPSIVLETLKPAEDGSGDLILRFYESARTRARARLHSAVPLRSAAWCNLLEAIERPIAADEAIEVTLRPFQIATLRLTPARNPEPPDAAPNT